VNATLIAVSGWVGLYRRSVYVRVIDAPNEINCIPFPQCVLCCNQPLNLASTQVILASDNKQIRGPLHKWRTAQMW